LSRTTVVVGGAVTAVEGGAMQEWVIATAAG